MHMRTPNEMRMLTPELCSPQNDMQMRTAKWYAHAHLEMKCARTPYGIILCPAHTETKIARQRIVKKRIS